MRTEKMCNATTSFHKAFDFVNFVSDEDSQNYQLKQLYIDSNSKTSRFTKLSACKYGSNF